MVPPSAPTAIKVADRGGVQESTRRAGSGKCLGVGGWVLVVGYLCLGVGGWVLVLVFGCWWLGVGDWVLVFGCWCLGVGGCAE